MVRLFSIDDENVEIIGCDDDQIYESVSYSPDGKNIIVAGKGKVIRQIELESGKIDELHGNYETIESVCYNSEGSSIISGGQDKILRVYNVNKKDSHIKKIKIKVSTVQAMDITSNAKFLAVIGYN